MAAKQRGAPTFAASDQWQAVPADAVLPPGLQIKIDLTTGQKVARLMPNGHDQEPQAQPRHPADDFGELDQEYAKAEGKAPSGPAPDAFPFTMLDAVAASLKNQWIIKGLIPRAGLGVIYGAPGSGKTAVALDMMLHVAAGIPYRGRQVEQAPIVYVVLEGHGGAANRVVGARDHLKLAGKALRFALVAVSADFRSQDNTAKVAAVARKVAEGIEAPATIIVLDTLQAALGPGGSDCDPRDVGALIEGLKAELTSHDMTAIAVHHSGKDATRGARGWSGLNAALDFEMEMQAADDLRTLVVSKMRDGPDNQNTMCYRLNSWPLGQDEYGDPVETVVVEHLADGGKGKSAKISVTARAALNKLWTMIKGGQGWYLQPDSDGTMMGNLHSAAGKMKVVGMGAWHNACVDEEPHISKAKQRRDRTVKFRAAVEALEEAGLIIVNRDSEGEAKSVGPVRSTGG